jgi:hypothetical protein
MTDTPSKPKRRRWRWALVITFLAITCSAWLWPGGDARFAGTWSMVDSNGEQVGTLMLKRFGLSSIKSAAPGSPSLKRQYLLYWEVKNGVLLFGNRPSEFNTLFGQLIHAAAKVPGALFYPAVDAFIIEDLTDDRIHLIRKSPHTTDDRAEIWLRRAEE